MQWIRKQQQGGSQLRLRGSQHSRLPSPIRMAAQKNPAENVPAQDDRRALDPGAVCGSLCRKGRTMRTRLPVWKIDAENGRPSRGESLRYSHQQRRSRVRSGTVRQNQPARARLVRAMQESPYGRGATGILEELDRGHATTLSRRDPAWVSIQRKDAVGC
jgi:hypothetical protein